MDLICFIPLIAEEEEQSPGGQQSTSIDAASRGNVAAEGDGSFQTQWSQQRKSHDRGLPIVWIDQNESSVIIH